MRGSNLGTPRGFPHFPLIIISVGALSVIDTLILTLEGDSVRRKGNLVFAVRPKQGVAYIFDDALVEMIGYQNDAAHGT